MNPYARFCPTCGRWNAFVREYKENTSKYEIIEGVIYKFLKPKEKELGKMLGGGKMVYILKFDGTIRQSNDYWMQGTVPEAYKEELPDTAIWISAYIADRYTKHKIQCEARQCFDRYKCLWYNVEEEEPFNTVPMNWKVGDEHCRKFINKDKIKAQHEKKNSQSSQRRSHDKAGS